MEGKVLKRLDEKSKADLSTVVNGLFEVMDQLNSYLQVNVSSKDSPGFQKILKLRRQLATMTTDFQDAVIELGDEATGSSFGGGKR